MKIILGPFHPQLEDAFVEAIRHFKSEDPLKPLLIIVPSDSLRRYLMRQLTLQYGLSLLNVRLFNFNQLSKMLYEEAEPNADLRLQDDLFFEEMLNLRLQGSEGDFSVLKASEGGTSALWQTLRDLKEGLLDPDAAIAALKEGHFASGAMKGRLPRLFKLYRQFKKTCEEQQIFDYGEISHRATQAVVNSPFLKSFGAIFYYGFYDLTQVLIDLLHEVARHYPTSLFFPLVPGAPAWHFSEQFFERYVEGLVSEKSQIEDLTKKTLDDHLFPHADFFGETKAAPLSPLQKKRNCTVISCYDVRDEVLTLAKEIVRLSDDGSLNFGGIGIFARDLDPYLTPIQDIFQKHAIPISSSSEMPLIQFPQMISVFVMTTLLVQDFPRASCIDLMTSPFFEKIVSCEGLSRPLTDSWDLLSRKAKITSGWESWQKLASFESETGRDISGQSSLFWRTFVGLYEDLNALPAKAAWADYARSWQGLFEKYLGVLPRAESRAEESETRSETERISIALSTILERLASLEEVSAQVSRDDFIAALQRGLKKATISFASHNIPGVSLMNIMQARGLSFRVVFVLGLNEGSFPRAIREDPFLGDPQRRVLETVLGYKVGEKLAAYDEEKLLFTLAMASGLDACYALYHRTDGLGRACAPSWYLGELKRVFQIEDENEVIIPRDLRARARIAPFDTIEHLLPSEWAITLSLRGENLDFILNQLPFSSRHYLRGKSALMQVEDEGSLSSFDGLIADSKMYWELLLKRGISPTGLEAYALCPFQYYGKHLLKLSVEEDPEDDVLPKTNDIGTLCHEILKVFYEGLDSESDFTTALKNNSVTQRLDSISETLFETYVSENTVLYPLHWEMLKTTILTLLSEVIEKDIAILSDSGYRPAAFEVDFRQQIAPEWPEFRGKIDRIDFNSEEGKARVVDYKITFRKRPLALEKNLLTSALRGKKLQAPIYLRLAEIFAEARAGSERGQTESVFYHLVPNWSDGPLVVSEFPESGWQGECGDMLKKTISILLQGLKGGRFFMKPGNHCDFCEVRAFCRLNHVPSLHRLQNDPLWQEQQALQKLKPPKKKKSTKT